MDLTKRLFEQLVELMRRDGLERLRLRVDDLDVDLRMHAAAPSGPAAAGAPGASPSPEPPPNAEPALANVRKVVAPLVGVFYRAAAPGAAPFVNVGDTVTKGQVLCILEAMKLMNEIVSEYDGKVVRACVNDGELVGLNQELFWIET